MVLHVNVALTDKQYNGTENHEEAELVQVFTSWEVSHLSHSATEWLEEVYSLPMKQCGCTLKWTMETS